VRALASILGGPKAMSRVVAVLGAVASRQAGAPLMADFLDIAADLRRRGEVKEAQDLFDAVFEGISRLQQVHSKAQLDLHNIESIFASFEMARMRQTPSSGRCVRSL
jgi:hypothetical protein